MQLDFFNIKINDLKKIKVALSTIYGFNSSKLKNLDKIIGTNRFKTKKLKDLNVYQISLLKQYLPELGIFDNELKKKTNLEYDKFFEIKCYKRNRFLLKLPANGQRTKSNANTVKRC